MSTRAVHNTVWNSSVGLPIITDEMLFIGQKADMHRSVNDITKIRYRLAEFVAQIPEHPLSALSASAIFRESVLFVSLYGLVKFRLVSCHQLPEIKTTRELDNTASAFGLCLTGQQPMVTIV